VRKDETFRGYFMKPKGVRGSIHIIKKDAENLVIASKEICLEVNAEKTKCMVMSRNQMQDTITT
jgi:hypothetical protein